jgi:leucyl aminopeptidase
MSTAQVEPSAVGSDGRCRTDRWTPNVPDTASRALGDLSGLPVFEHPPVLPDLALATEVTDVTADVLVVPVFRGAIAGPGASVALEELGLTEVPRSQAFRGKVGEVTVLANPGGQWGRIAFVGLGRMDELRPEQVRRAAGAVARELLPSAASLVTTLAEVDPEVSYIRAVAEGLLLGAHRDDRYRTSPKPRRLAQVTIVVPSSLEDASAQVLDRARAHALGQAWARELVTTPPGDLGPQDIVDWASAVLGGGSGADGSGSAGSGHLEVEAWDVERLRAERCGGVLAVGQGSAREPRMLIVRYRPDNAVAHVGLVGKGITFDSGGLSLKPADSMQHMKDDMGGAAVVLGVMSALPELAPRVAVTAWCPLAENMPSGAAQRPGDVFTARNGKTVQVLNTDAEGRLVMADALSLAAEENVDALVDVATLTGAVSHAVGKRAVGVFGNDDDLLRQVLAAADDAGEAAWHLPLWEDLREGLDSEVADLDNIWRDDHGRRHDRRAVPARVRRRRPVGAPGRGRCDVGHPGARPPAVPGHRRRRAHHPAVAGVHPRLSPD